MIETPAKGRANISKVGNKIEIEIPAKKQWFTIIFLCAWMTGWAFGEIFAITTLTVGDSPLFANVFLVFWLTVWTIGGLAAVKTLLWLLAGLEIIRSENGVLEVGRQTLGFNRSKKYATKDIRNLQINPGGNRDTGNFGNNSLKKTTGVVKFDYGLQTVYFGSEIDEAEGRHIIELFRKNISFKEDNFAGVNTP